MSLWQCGQDHYHLTRTNKLIRRMSDKVAGSKVIEEGIDEDFGIAFLALTAGEYTFALDYLNCDDDDDLKLSVNGGGKYIGSKSCNSYPHLLNTINKIMKMTPEEARTYLGKEG